MVYTQPPERLGSVLSHIEAPFSDNPIERHLPSVEKIVER
jgi:hypothetical protein